MNDENKIDELLNDSFRNYREMPDDAIWNNIEAELGREEKRKRFFWWWWPGIGLLLLLSGWGASHYLLTNEVKSGKNTTSDSIKVSSTSSEKQVVSKGIESGMQDKNALEPDNGKGYVSEEQVASAVVITTDKAKNRTDKIISRSKVKIISEKNPDLESDMNNFTTDSKVKSVAQDSIVNSASRKKNTSSDDKVNIIKAKQPFADTLAIDKTSLSNINYKNEILENKTDTVIISSPVFISDSMPVFDKMNYLQARQIPFDTDSLMTYTEIPLAEPDFPKNEAGFFLAPELAMINPGNVQLPNNLNAEKTLPRLSAGLNYGRRIGKWLGVSSGISYTSLKFQMHDPQYFYFNKYNNQDYNFYNSQGFMTASYAVMLNGFYFNAPVDTFRIQYQYHAQIDYIRIPLEVKVYALKKSVYCNLSGGVSFQRTVRQYGMLEIIKENNRQQVETNDLHAGSSLLFMQAGMEFGYQRKRHKIYAMPQWSAGLNNPNGKIQYLRAKIGYAFCF